MSGQWSGGTANRHWGRPGSRVLNVTGDAERGRRLSAALAGERFWCDNCGRLHPLAEHRGCRAAGLSPGGASAAMGIARKTARKYDREREAT